MSKTKQITFKCIGLLLVIVTATGCRVGELSFGVEARPTNSNPSHAGSDTQSPEIRTPVPPTLTPTPMQEATPTPAANETIACTDLAEFVQDLSVQDGEEFEPGEIFLKTWRLRNAGTCTWDQEYTYVHFGGDLLGAYDSQPLPGRVQPGELLDLTIAMTAPQMPGQYLSEWVFQDASGNAFGVGPGGTAPFWVRINVVPLLTDRKATPYAESPAAGICPEIEGEIVSMTINPDIPEPRCVIVKPDQRLRVVNNLDSEITASLGSLSAKIIPNAEHTFEKTFGELLMPGVHNLGVTPCCGGSIWLK